jgi:leucyl aminopeptidase
MKIELSAGDIAELATSAKASLLVIGVHAAKVDDREKPKAKSSKGSKKTAAPSGPAYDANKTFRALDAALGGALSAQAARDEFSGKANAAFSVASHGRIPADSVLVLGLGDKGKHKPAALRAFAARAARTTNAEKGKSLAIVAPADDEASLRALAEGAQLGAWRFTKYLTGDRAPKARIDATTIITESGGAGARAAIELGAAIGRAVCLTRDLVTEPPNVLNAPELADRAAAMSKENGLKISVFDKAEIQKRGMHLLLAVNQGSTIEPRFVHMVYSPKKKAQKRLVFVGKGLTFDSGGLCIKPADGMLDMKVDMSGAANVVGLMAAVAALKPNVEVHGIFAATDNMPDGNAYRPGDVFGSLDGKSVEIINTDAEGRLVLADALAYARALEPDLIVDNATLTGACMVALGNYCSGFYVNRDELATEIEKSAAEAGEQMWHMPLLEDLRDQLKSEIADLKHTGSRYGGSITAALFLREFVGDVPWAHFDIAGPVTTDKPSGFYVKGATGHPVLTFLRMIERAAEG